MLFSLKIVVYCKVIGKASELPIKFKYSYLA